MKFWKVQKELNGWMRPYMITGGYEVWHVRHAGVIQLPHPYVSKMIDAQVAQSGCSREQRAPCRSRVCNVSMRIDITWKKPAPLQIENRRARRNCGPRGTDPIDAAIANDHHRVANRIFGHTINNVSVRENEDLQSGCRCL